MQNLNLSTGTLFIPFRLRLLPRQQGSAAWLPTAAAILLIVALLALLAWLYKEGKLQAWFKAGIDNTRWQYRQTRLGADLKNMEREKAGLHEDLGAKAWEAQVDDPAYASAYTEVQSINQQIAGLREQISTLEAWLGETSQQRADLVEQFDGQVSQLETARKNARSRLDRLQTDLKRQDAELTNVIKDKARFQRDIKNTRTRIIELENSDDPARGELLPSLNTTLDGLTQQLLHASNAEPTVNAEISRLNTELQPVRAEIQAVEDEIDRTQDLKRQDLNPMDQRIDNLRSTINARMGDIKGLETTLQQGIRELGPLVDEARPSSPALQESYTRLDAVSSKMAAAIEDRDRFGNLISTADKTAVRSFWLVVAGVILVIIAAIVLLTVL